MLLSQYFYNKGYVASCNWFLSRLTTNITFYLSLITCHLNFIVKFLWKCRINSVDSGKYHYFGPSLKKYNNNKPSL